MVPPEPGPEPDVILGLPEVMMKLVDPGAEGHINAGLEGGTCGTGTDTDIM